MREVVILICYLRIQPKKDWQCPQYNAKILRSDYVVNKVKALFLKIVRDKWLRLSRLAETRTECIGGAAVNNLGSP
jgi:hypothetical protein